MPHPANPLRPDVLLWLVLGLAGMAMAAQPSAEPRARIEGGPAAADTAEVRALIGDADGLRQSQPEVARETAERALRLARSLDFPWGIAEASAVLGHLAGDLARKKEHYILALETFEGIDERLGATRVRLFLGHVYSDHGEVERALAAYFEALRGFEQFEDAPGQIMAMSSIGNAQRSQGNLAEALIYHARAVGLAEQADGPGQLVVALLNLGAALSDHGSYEDAEAHFRRALDVAEAHDYRRFSAYISNNLGGLLVAQGQYRRARPYLVAARRLAQELGEDALLIAVYDELAKLHIGLGEHDRAVRFGGEGLALAQDLGLYQMEVHETLSRVYEAAGDPARALDHLRQHAAVKDSLFSAERTSIITEMQTRYETEEQRHAIERLEHEKQIQALRASRQRTGLLGGIVVAFLMAGLFYNRYRLKQKANRILEAQKEEIRASSRLLREKQLELQGMLREKDLLVKEIHHRVKNNLQIISSLLDLQAGILDDPRARSALKDALGRVQSMALVHRKLNRKQDLGQIDVHEYSEELCRYLIRAFNADHVRCKVDVDAIRFDVDTAIPFGLILAELVSNALKHAFPGGREGEITVSLRRTGDDGFELAVADDGVGLAAAHRRDRKASIGLTLVQDLTRQLRGDLQVRNGRGVTYRVRFPGRIIAS